MRSNFGGGKQTDLVDQDGAHASARPPILAPHWAGQLARFMDDGISIPGTRIKIGFDGLLGMLVPVLGDATTATVAIALFWLAVQRGVPRVVLARMALNVGLDALLGSVPVLGDLFDFAWKANRKNLELIERSATQPQRPTRVSDSLVVALFILFVLTTVALPFVLMGYLLAKL